ncbi:MAG TPA: hypothetical protein PLZ50_10745 [Rubrivivax sp.]|nr:hypothetical protein [Rubrivivax sp.]
MSRAPGARPPGECRSAGGAEALEGMRLAAHQRVRVALDRLESDLGCA